MEEPRTHVNMMRDLLERVTAHEWVSGYERCPRNCCDDYFHRCSECEADAGDQHKNPEKYKQHKPGCQLAALILEVEAYLSIEEKLQEEREEAEWLQSSSS